MPEGYVAMAVSREVVDEFYRAYVSRDAERIGAMIDDDVEWVVNGPVQVMQVCGIWHGKAAVIERFAVTVPGIIAFKSLDIESLLVDGDSSALFGRISCVHRPTGRQICHRVGHLAHYRDGKVISLRVMNDSLDAAEQYVGHHIALTDDAPAMSDDLVAL
jgi:ketosteroid isomerase-like protein